jgi:hypothetical protein
LDRVDRKVDQLDDKMDKMDLRHSHEVGKVAADLAEHIADPDANQRAGYRVREESVSFGADARINLTATVDEMRDQDPDKEEK